MSVSCTPCSRAGVALDQLSQEYVIRFLLFVLPGFISVKVYSLFAAVETRSAAALAFEALAFGVLNAFVFFPLTLLLQLDQATLLAHPVYGMMGLAFALIVLPALWGWGFYRLLRWLGEQGLILSRAHTGFDYLFGQRKPCWLILHLADGGRVGCFFGDMSYASLYPHSGHLYCEEVWELGDDGSFVRPVPRTGGMIFRPDSYRLVEVFRLDAEKRG